MTAVEWDQCQDPMPMLEALRTSGRASERKLRLFCLACCRHIIESFSDTPGLHYLEVGDQYAEGQATEQELEHTRTESRKVRSRVFWTEYRRKLPAGAVHQCLSPGPELVWNGAQYSANCVSLVAGCLAEDRDARTPWAFAFDVPSVRAAWLHEKAAQADLLRDIFANPFHPPICVEDAWLTDAVLGLAADAYENRMMPSGILEQGRVFALANALEEAGCSDPMILGHLRGQGPHVRSCQVVDRLLGKE